MGYYAKTRIDAGRADKDSQPRVFEVGQEVTGLSDAEIKQLQDAGSLSDRPPREGEPGYQAAPDSDATKVQQEREQAQRDAATSGVGGPSSQRTTSGTSNNEAQQRERDRDQAQRDRTAQTSTADATSQPLTSSTAATGREPPGPETTSTKQRR